MHVSCEEREMLVVFGLEIVCPHACQIVAVGLRQSKGLINYSDFQIYKYPNSYLVIWINVKHRSNAVATQIKLPQALG